MDALPIELELAVDVMENIFLQIGNNQYHSWFSTALPLCVELSLSEFFVNPLPLTASVANLL